MNNKIKKIIILILLVIACLILGSLISLGLFTLLGYDKQNLLSEDMPSSVLKATLAINHFCAIFLPALLFIILIKKDTLNFSISKKIKKLNGLIVLKAVGLIFLGLMASSLIVMQLEKINLPDWANAMDEQNMQVLKSMLEMDGIGSFLINLFVIAVMPAIGEELLFRSVLQNEVLGWFKNHHYAIILTSFLFAAFHMEIMGLVPKFAIGLVLGYVYYWSGNIMYPVILHFINNGFQVLLLFIIGQEIDMESQEVATNSDYILLICSIPLIYLLAKSIRSDFYDRSNA